jgi:hypothetical protein
LANGATGPFWTWFKLNAESKSNKFSELRRQNCLLRQKLKAFEVETRLSWIKKD